MRAVRRPIVALLLVVLALLVAPALCQAGWLAHPCDPCGKSCSHEVCGDDPCVSVAMPDALPTMAALPPLLVEWVVATPIVPSVVLADDEGPPPRVLPYHGSDLPLRI